MVRELEQDFRERLAALRWQAEQESEALLQQGEREGGALREELRLLHLQEVELREELGAAAQVGHLISGLTFDPSDELSDFLFVSTCLSLRRGGAWRRSFR